MISAAASPPRLFTLVLLTGLSVLSLNMFLPSLSNIAEEFQADYALVNLSIAGYLGVTAAMQLVMGPLSDRLGRRPVLLAGLAIFIVSSLGCMLSTSIWAFLVFRVLQGAIISGWVLSLAIIRDTSNEQEAASLIGYVAMAMAVSPMLGPMLGGMLDELFGWRSNFLFFTVFGVTLFGLCWVDLGETNKHPSETFTRQFQAYPELFRSRRFWGFALCMSFSTGAFYVFLAGVPLVAESVLALSPATLGFYMGTITAGFMLGSFLSGRYAQQFPLTTMMILGRLVGSAGLLMGLTLFAAGYINPVSLFGSTVFAGLGNGLTMPSANAGALSVRPGLAGSASGLAGALTVGGGAVLTSVTGVVLTVEYGVFQLLGIMLFCSLAALFAAIYVLRIDQREGGAGIATSEFITQHSCPTKPHTTLEDHMTSNKIEAGSRFPEIEAQSLQGEMVALGKPANGADWRMVVVYRGKHCPICTKYLNKLESFSDKLEEARIDLVAVSGDSKTQLTEHLEKLDVTFPLLYGLTINQMQELGLYVSHPRSEQETDHPFPEPGMFVINDKGQVHVVDIANNPFVRPDLEQLVSGLAWIKNPDNNYPIRGTYP